MQTESNEPLSEQERGRLARIAAVHRELDRMKAVDAAIAAGPQLRSARVRTGSLAYSIRLDRGEVEALEHRAAASGLKPTVLARNLIRMGLDPGGACDLTVAVDRLTAAVDDLRRLVGG